jgi:hypothetical protein
MVKAQFDSLSKVHAALDGREACSWKISAPRPLHMCQTPLALVMTVVPGQYIDLCAPEGEVLTSEVLHEAASAFASAMENCWTNDQRHGDLGLRNVLFDIGTKKISFIDAGTRDSCRTCSEVEKFPSAMVSDLAHVLCDVVIDVMDLVGSNARLGREIFAENILRIVIADSVSSKEKRRLLEEIESCFQEHLAEYLQLSWSLKGVSHRVVKQVAINRVRSMLERVASEQDVVVKRTNPRLLGTAQLE